MISQLMVSLAVGLALRCGPNWSVVLRIRQADHDIIADRRGRFQRQIRGVDPEAGPFTIDRAGEESIDPLVDFLAEIG